MKGLESGDCTVIKKSSPADLQWMQQWMTERSVSTLYLCGVPLEHTIYHTALEACKMGIAVFVISDGTVALEGKAGLKAKEELVKNGVSFVESGRM